MAELQVAKEAPSMSPHADSDLRGCDSQSGGGPDKSEHCPIPEAEDSKTSNTTEKTSVSPSLDPRPETSTGAPQADGHTMDSENENVPATGSIQHNNSSSTASVPHPWQCFPIHVLPYHPGWTRELSPSFCPMHSTAPEISKWAQSPGIKFALKYEREAIRGCCMDLQRAAVVLTAMQQLDDFDFPGFMFPYGAWGMKRPVKNAYLPKRPATKQRSKLYISTTLEASGTEH